MAGSVVTRGDIDRVLSKTIVSVREGFKNVDVVKGYLDQFPSDAVGGDFLTRSQDEGGFGYSEDEAYLIRLIFDQLHALEVDSVLEIGRKLTGLE